MSEQYCTVSVDYRLQYLESLQFGTVACLLRTVLYKFRVRCSCDCSNVLSFDPPLMNGVLVQYEYCTVLYCTVWNDVQ